MGAGGVLMTGSCVCVYGETSRTIGQFCSSFLVTCVFFFALLSFLPRRCCDIHPAFPPDLLSRTANTEHETSVQQVAC